MYDVDMYIVGYDGHIRQRKQIYNLAIAYNTYTQVCVFAYLLTYQTPMAGDLLLFRMKKLEV